ncbi:hypothetical protein LNKW23_18120 [Paralimibaculum aggregatum]|uniref:Uncharacterized protein n=1 Tax=Paralimibaculum aggregatum TaxID=3036245 RepID=A0ABQ6LK76_9RHOB|nr:hypothetical protein [Limibaculum sp. NKW23]GMG82599.1 hypothetical protein LNKW23_18120 [Limibaculum sp. NKW23]
METAEATTEAETAETCEPKVSRRRVRERLLDRLREAGLRKPKGVRAEEHEAMLDRLPERLAYMSAASLDALAEAVIERAEGANRNLWPGEVAVLNIARQIQRPPVDRDRLVLTYMASAAGRAAWDRSPWEALALSKWLREYGAPQKDRHWERIGEEAAGIARRVEWLRRQKANGDAEAARELAEWDGHAARMAKLVGPEAGS